MVKAEWGAKHGCPKCGTRFYDLGKDDPVTCIECSYSWQPEPVLKSKQPLPFEEVVKVKVEVVEDVDLADEDLDIDDGDSPDNDVDLGGDDDLGVTQDEADERLAAALEHPELVGHLRPLLRRRFLRRSS